MEPTLKQSSSFGWASSVEISQLDKINAIPNKTTDNILLDDLCQEDQLYLNALIDNDSSEHEDDEDTSRRSSTWSPMAQSPVIMNKRIKKLRPAYAVTLSLEDISYIRPSWGISKGVRTIKKHKKKPATELSSADRGALKDRSEKSGGSTEASYHQFLVLLTVVVFLLTVPSYIFVKRKEYDKVHSNKILLNSDSKTLEIYKPDNEALEPILKVQFAQSIPRDLRPDECTCDIYSAETRRYNPDEPTDSDVVGEEKNCFACLDWAVRANLRVYVDKQANEDSFCYHIKWQSYDALLTPLVDCFMLNDDDWFGLGDVQASSWPLNKLQLDWTPLVTNLSAEFLSGDPTKGPSDQLELGLGSYVNYSIFSTNGIHIGNVRTDFQASFKISQEPKSGAKRMCLSVSCTDKCTQTWTRIDHIDRLRYHNNMLEYSICSAKSLNELISSQLEARTQSLLDKVRKFEPSEVVKINNSGTLLINGNSSAGLAGGPDPERLVERESSVETIANDSSKQLGLQEPAVVDNGTLSGSQHELPEGIGLIERTIFATSLEFMPVLDGQTLRQFVDNIVKLGLKTSSILSIDTRWETYVGSLKLNVASFPKAKILFEILHNKGFKIVLTVKPYVDTGIGVSNINQLLDSGRLYTTSYRKDTYFGKFTAQLKGSSSINETIIRRQSLFAFQNQSIEIKQRDSLKVSYLSRCKESQEGYCVLLDLTQPSNKAWLINTIRRSSLLTSEADGIQIGGVHPNGFYWDDHYRMAVSELAETLFYKEKIFAFPQWTGDFGYIQLAPRHCNWNGLRSIVNSVLNMGMLGFSLVHPGSVWGDLKSPNSTQGESFKSPNRMDSIYGDVQSNEKSDEELMIRWLQVSMFLPILQFNNIAPIERYGLQDLLQNLVRIRKSYLVPELKKNLPFTPLITQSKPSPPSESSSPRPPQPSKGTGGGGGQLPLIRPVWYSQEDRDSIIMEQFAIGPDILVAPILSEGLRQRDIYLPSGFWRDELRQINLRGGKWLRNYPVELNEIAWFTRAKR